VATVLKFLREISMPVTTETEILNVCNVSSNYNRSVAEIVAKTLNTVGLEGVINMTESPTGYSRFALVNGLVVERGFVSNLFVETD
jgi:chaperonin GroEL